MDFNLVEQNFIIVKGYVDAKDDRGDDINGVFFAVVSMHETKFQGIVFSRDKKLEKKNREEIIDLINSKDNLGDERDFLAIQCEEELLKYFEMSRLMNGIAKNRNLKHAEQIISRFFMDKLHLKAVTFIEFTNPSPLELDVFAKAAPRIPKAEKKEKPDVRSTEKELPVPKKDERDMLLTCEPVYDPVSGVAPTELEVGAWVVCRLPESSIFYKLLKNNISDFDGVIEGEISNITFNDEIGSAILSLTFSDGVSGTVKLSSKARIKTAGQSGKASRVKLKETKRRTKHPHNVSDNIVFLAAFLVIAGAAVAVIVYLMKGL